MKFNHLKSVICYSIELPSRIDTELALAKREFADILSTQFDSYGFVKNPVTGEMVTPFADASRGYSFVLRHDSKIIPPAVVRAEVDRRAKAEEEETLQKVYRKRRNELKDLVLMEMAQTALVSTTLTHAFYDAKAQRLYVSSTKKRADRVTLELVQAFGALKATTIYFDGVRNGLTNRLLAWLDDVGYDQFDGFYVGGFVQVSSEHEVVRYDVGDLGSSTLGLGDNLHAGFSVDKLALNDGDDVSFVLDSNFRLSKITFQPINYDDDEDQAHVWRSEAYYRVTVLSDLVDKLTAMLKPAQAETTETDDVI